MNLIEANAELEYIKNARYNIENNFDNGPGQSGRLLLDRQRLQELHARELEILDAIREEASQ